MLGLIPPKRVYYKGSESSSEQGKGTQGCTNPEEIVAAMTARWLACFRLLNAASQSVWKASPTFCTLPGIDNK